jgi:hypothetical protein
MARLDYLDWTAEQLDKAADDQLRSREESWERSDTDGFLSQWASGLTADLYRTQADIVRNGGKAEFPALFTLDGVRLNAKVIDTRFGPAWAFLDPHGKFTGKFLTAYKNDSYYAKRGYKIVNVLEPARAVIRGSGRGLSGQAWVAVERVEG